MRFWAIEKIKSDIANDQLSQKDVLKYWLAGVLLYRLLWQLPIRNIAAPQYGLRLAMFISTLFISIVGIVSCYRANGREHGERLLDRYTAIFFVMSIRGLVFALLPFCLLAGFTWGAVGAIVGMKAVDGKITDVLANASYLYYLCFAWLGTARHLKLLRSRVAP